MKLETIGVIVRPGKPEAVELVRELRAWCGAHGIILRAAGDLAEQADCAPLAVVGGELAEAVDLIVVLGGDGTMLGASRFIGAQRVPVLGVNFGWLGYLTEFTLSELFPALDGLRRGEFDIERRMMLDVRIERAGHIVFAQRALNEVVVTKAGAARMIELECFVNERFVNSFRADGMIVATPTGSTAYSLSAAGPIVHPSMAAMLLTPICPHLLSNRPVILPDDSVVSLVFTRANRELSLTVDGQIDAELLPDDRVVVRRSAVTFDLVRQTRRDYFEVLRTKLKWGTR